MQSLSSHRPDRRSAARPTFAALDLGTNNCRLLVAAPQQGGFEVLDSFSRIVRLGEGLDATNRLGDPAIERTIAALRVCRRIMQRQHVTRARCVATEACRRAENGAEFVRLVEEAIGIRLEVLRHDEEAHLALLGCLPLVRDDVEHVLMIDIGGGSTEIVLVDCAALRRSGEVVLAVSLPVGVVTLAERFGSEPDEAAYAAMIRHVGAMLREIESMYGVAARIASGATQFIGTSGTVTTLAALHLGLRRYDRRRIDGVVMPYAAAESEAKRLRGMDDLARAHHPCIGKGRADLVVAGCAVVEAIHAQWPMDSVTVADRGVREGILATLMDGAGDRSTPTAAPFAPVGRQLSGQRVVKSRVRTAKSRTHASTLWLERQLNDPFVQRAKAAGFRARSVFKLEEIDRRFGLIRRGSRVLDLGAAPGSWTQYAVARGARVVAIDLLPMNPVGDAVVLRGDALDPDVQSRLRDALGGRADIVLSDMAANATGTRAIDRLRAEGIAETVLEVAAELLEVGGNCLIKLVKGAESKARARALLDFRSVELVRPAATRKDSSEMFMLARERKPPSG